MHHGIGHTPWTYPPPDIPTPRHTLDITTSPPGYTPCSDIWWSSLETCSNLFTWGHTHPLGLTSIGGHRSRQYVSYWNAFFYLLFCGLLYFQQVLRKNYAFKLGVTTNFSLSRLDIILWRHQCVVDVIGKRSPTQRDNVLFIVLWLILFSKGPSKN